MGHVLLDEMKGLPCNNSCPAVLCEKCPVWMWPFGQIGDRRIGASIGL